MKPDALVPQVYEELRKLAAAKLASEKPGPDVDATGLVHEALQKLGGDRSFASRSDYLKAAAQAMRRILVDRARARNAAKRGGGRRDELESHQLAFHPADDFEGLDAAFSRLSIEHPRIAELIQLRYFGGLTLAECAEVLDVSERTADTWWAYGRAWLAVNLKENGPAFGRRTACTRPASTTFQPSMPPFVSRQCRVTRLPQLAIPARSSSIAVLSPPLKTLTVRRD